MKIEIPYKLSKFEESNIHSFFSRFHIKDSEAKKAKAEPAKKVLAFFAFILLSVLSGVIFAIPGIIALSITAVVSEDTVNTWQSLPSELETISIAERNTFYDINGQPFAEIWTQNRILLDSLDDVSPYAIRALIDTEDQRFYDHSGIDTIGTARSLVYGTGGGSGITQQLVKNLQFYNYDSEDPESATEYSIARKIQELKYSLQFEENHTKNEILLEYFNTVSFGNPNVYSIEAASQYFFSKSAKDLTLSEASALIGTAQNPSLYNLDNEDDSQWKDRQYQVLQRMVAQGDITQHQADVAYTQVLIFNKAEQNGNCYSSKYPFYCDYVLDYLKNSEKLGSTQSERDAILARGGLNVYTYLDPKVMDIADQTLEANFTNTHRVVAPVSVVQPGTGGVLAISVNREYGKGDGETEINVPLNPTGTGSTYKMFTLATALNQGFTEEDLAFSSRCPLYDPDYDMPASGSIKNSSSCALQGGYMDYKKATALSSNTWFSELTIKVGVENIKEFSRSVGLSAPDEIGGRSLSYTLGTTSNSPVNMAAAFATFANDGIYCPPTPVMSYSYSDGTEPEVPESYDGSSDSCRKVMSAHDAGIVLQAMRANISGEIPNAFGIGKDVPGYDTVAKSGTNQLYNLAWSQISGQYSLYINVYDMDKLVNEIDYISYKGQITRWFNNAAADSGWTIMKKILEGEENIPLNYESSDDTLTPIKSTSVDKFEVPSVIGMPPSVAISVLKNSGITAHVSVDERDDSTFPSGVIIEQSIDPGTNLNVGTTKEVILYVNKGEYNG